MNKIIKFCFFVSLLVLTSCSTRKIVYVNDMVPDSTYQSMTLRELTIQSGDRLSILVSAKAAELAEPFNSGMGSYAVTSQGEVQRNPDASGGQMQRGYLVNTSGQIDFPVLGKIQAAGLTLTELKTAIENLLITNKYIKDPVVKTELINLKVNVMGEVLRVGVIDVPEGKINLFEAISRAGGLTTNADPKQVTVIREEGGVRKMIVNDIEAVEIFNSPTYYLQQNDIVYVTPIDPRPTPKQENNWRIFSVGTGLVSIAISLATLLSK